MKNSAVSRRIVNIIFIFVLISGSVLSVKAFDNSAQTDEGAIPEEPVVARVYFEDQAQIDQFASELDIWEMHREQGYLIAVITPARFESYLQSGYRIEIDEEKTALLTKPLQMLPGQLDGIPGYPCYRTVEETYEDMANLAVLNPVLASWIDIGDSWEKVMDPNAGYDIHALVLTNKNIPGPKPTFFLMAEIHAREYTTAELAARFAEFLVDNYGTDPDVTWLLDYFEVHIVPMTNPDGRILAEAGNYWRKNTDNDDGCNDPNNWGTDLNRNHSFKWDMGGSDDYPCGTTYHGPSAASEPEVGAIQSYVLTLFPDQRGSGDTDPAPTDTTGVLISLHSYSQLVLWPWGWTSTDAPNHAQLRTLGRKFAYFNSYTAQQSNDLYPTSGTSDDWSYGELGIASYTFELGTSFFQGCTTFENTILPDNMPALFYAFKAARRPYMNPAGPDSLDVSVDPVNVMPGDPVTLTATADDTRYSYGEPSQSVQAARYSIDDPSWITGTVTYDMSAVDGSFNETVEDLVATVDTTGLSAGTHIIFVESQDADGNWGAPSAVFLEITVPTYGAALFPEDDSQQADPGETVTYTLEVDNFGAFVDTYTITLDSGWAASAPASIGPIDSGESAFFDVLITIPLSADGAESDSATVGIQSQNDPSVSDTSELVTTANYYDLSFSPAQASQYGVPGAEVVYSLEVSNLGNTTDSYDLTPSGSWEITAPAVIGPLEPGESAAFDVTVAIPGDAVPGESDLGSLTLVSQGDSDKTAIAELTTYAGVVGPLVSPADLSAVGDPSRGVEYTITITNAGAVVDNFNVSVLDSSWDTDAPDGSGLIAPGMTRSIQVTVRVPDDALAGASDSATIEISSDRPEVVPVYVHLTTTANSFYALSAQAQVNSKAATQLGETVIFEVEITNLGNTADTYDLSASSIWQVSLPAVLGPLAPGETGAIQLIVQVPEDASSGDANVTTLTVISQNDPLKSGQVVLNTRLLDHLVFLPVSFKD